MLNEKLAYAKSQYEKAIGAHENYQQDIIQKIARYEALTPRRYDFATMSVQEMVDTVALLEQNPKQVWEALCKGYSRNFFVEVIEEEFGQMFTKKDQDRITKEINHVGIYSNSLSSGEARGRVPNEFTYKQQQAKDRDAAEEHRREKLRDL